MIYREFKGLQLSALGFGAMRLPVQEDGSIDEARTEEMIRYAMENGVNYFDTAYPYHGGMSEVVLCKYLNQYPRDSFYLADKYPGHQIVAHYDPAAVFEDQLKKCGVEYFDFYLLHDIFEKSIETYLDPRWGIVDYFVEQKRLGRIRHLGFSAHGGPENLKAFLDAVGEHMEFCQIQLNYLDWKLQDAKTKCAILAERNIPVWVMEPVRGGKLANLSEANTARLHALRPAESTAAWCFRWMQTVPETTVVLSGMSNMEQIVDNVKTYSEEKPLSGEEIALLEEIAEELMDAIPCTACRYCCDGCPAGLDIPGLLGMYNDARVAVSVVISQRMSGFDKDKWPSACIGCGACEAICPQGLKIPQLLGEFDKLLEKVPNWEAICAEREAAAKRAKS